MNNNDCAIQSLTRVCKNSVVIIFMFCGLGSRVVLFLQTQRNPQYSLYILFNPVAGRECASAGISNRGY